MLDFMVLSDLSPDDDLSPNPDPALNDTLALRPKVGPNYKPSLAGR